MHPVLKRVPARPVKSASLIFGIFVAHVALGVILYRGRAVSGWVISNSDSVVFTLPYVLAAAGYFHALRWMPRLQDGWVARVLISLVIAFFSWWGLMLIALNTYGS